MECLLLFKIKGRSSRTYGEQGQLGPLLAKLRLMRYRDRETNGFLNLYSFHVALLVCIGLTQI